MPHFSIDAEIKELTLANPFTISRGTKKTVPNVFVSLRAQDLVGYGEAAPNSRYDEDAESVKNCINNLPPSFLSDVTTPEELLSELDSLKSAPQSAKAALEMAWLDWWGKLQEQPLWRLWSTPSNSTPATSFTIGLDEIEVMQQKVQEAEEFPILKIKLGTDRDREIIKVIRAITDKPIRVDANEGWTDLATAKEQIAYLADQHIELVEQPMPASMHEQLVKLKKWSPLPLIADESFKGTESLIKTACAFDGINIKLMKIGSLIKARDVIHQAQKAGLKVMIGCMIESSLAISAAALLGTWADYVDLDGHLLIKEDPFEGLSISEQKQIVLAETAGLTVSPISGLLK